MSGIDHLLQLLRKQREEGGRRGTGAHQILGRFLVTKLSWRGSYRRLLLVTPTHITTLYPDTLAVTNSWAYAGDHDLAGIEVGGDHAEGGLFTLHFRRDKKGLKTKDVKFACRERAALLSLLYRGVELAVARGSSGLGPTLLGPIEQFPALKLRKGRWMPAALRVTTHAIERVDASTGLVKWRLEYRHMASPAARLLAPGEGQPSGQAAFALFGKTGRSPRVYCCHARDSVLKAMQTAALRKLGLTLAVDANAALAGPQLLAAVAAAERERAATAADAPLGEWEVMRVRDLDAADLAASRQPGGAADVAGAAADVAGWSGVAHRRLVLTQQGVLERRPGDYEVAEWRQLAAVAALVRFSEDPQWLAVEWADGTPATTYVTPARDALLAALLDAAQTAAGRPIAVLCHPTAPGDPVVSQRAQAVGVPTVAPDVELERFCLHQLNAAAREFMQAGGGAASLAVLALAGLTAASSAAAAAGVGGSDGGAAGDGASETGSDAAAEGSPHSGGGGSASGLFSSGRSSFMQRAFARQAQMPPAAGPSAASGGHIDVAGGGGAGAEAAFAAFQQRVREFNACVPYAGLSAGCKVDDVAILALLAHLPRQQAAAGHGLGSDEARLAVASLQCLQRLAGASVVASGRAGSAVVGMSQIIGAAGGSGRIFASLMSGHDHVAAESARLLLRFFSPAAARAGAGPWTALPPGGGGEVGGSGGTAVAAEVGEDEAAAVHSAKSVCFISHSRCAALVGVLRRSRAAPLLSMAVAEAAAAVACEPGSRTTEQATLEALLQETAALGRPLFALFLHPAPRVAHAAALLMRAVAEGGAEAAQPMREAALTEGATLQHLLSAVSQRPGVHTALSRDLVALWADEFSPALALLKRVFPPGLIRYLNQPRQQRAQQQKAAVPTAAAQRAAPSQQPAEGQVQQQVQQQAPAEGQAATALSATQQLVAAASTTPAPAVPAEGGAHLLPQKAQQAQQPAVPEAQQAVQQRPRSPPKGFVTPPPPPRTGTLKGNWEAFWAAAGRDHSHAALIWNEGTRTELREALQAEEASLRLARLRQPGGGASRAGASMAGTSLAWNHQEFRVAYPSLSKHLSIGGVYVRLLLEPPPASAAAAVAAAGGTRASVVERLPAPKEFFSAVHHRLLCLGDASLLPPGLAVPSAAAGGAAGWASQRQWDAEGDRELCVRAMTAAYHVHAGAIGPVEGISHLAALLDATPSRSLRHRLLLLFEALVAPRVLHAAASSSGEAAADDPADGGGVVAAADALRGSQEAEARAAHANGVALLEAGGVALLVDMLAAAHEASERPVAALQTNLIAATSHAEERREWFYYSQPPPQGQGGGGESRLGPVSKAEIRQLLSSGAATAATFFWAAGMPEPLPLGAIRELRWWVAHRLGPLTAFEAAGTALRVLQALADQQPAVDPAGDVLHPLPLAHRQMASSTCLPHIAQLVLTGEPALVGGACTLLLTVLRHNADGLAALYRTGIHFFLLAYCGSNLREAARLLKACHLGSTCADVAAAGRQLAQRSILGGLLPESLLHMLEGYGPGQFATALVGDSDTPELIWTHQMRLQRLVPQMLRHLGDFPRRLRESCHAVYEYLPCPPVGYPEIEGEVFCHRYYLKHLTDERYAAWPLADHVQLLQCLLDAWRAELARKPLSMSEEDACKVLGITPQADGTISEDELKAAYRRLARLYHPDKNPAGRDQFVGVQAAYERLQGGAAGGQGPQPWRVLLLLRAQCVLFRRAPQELEPFKYAGFPLLLQAVALPEGGEAAAGKGTEQHHFLSAEAAPQLQAATELCWLTCACSRLNGEELTRAGGLRLLGRLLMRCIAVMPKDAAAQDPAAVIATHALRALAVMSAFENARAELAHSHQLLNDIVLCCSLQRAPAAVEAALLCLARCCASGQLQAALLSHGMLGHVVPMLLAFDATLAKADAAQQPLPSPDDATGVLRLPLLRLNVQATKNLHAQLAVRALASLAGYPPGPSGGAETQIAESEAEAREGAAAAPTPPCPAAQRALGSLMTETLAPRLREADVLPLLRDLNSTVQTPQVIWNNSMRAELLQRLEQLRASSAAAPAASSTGRASGGPEAAEEGQEGGPAAVGGFTYKCLQGELIVAGVFVRVFTEQPDFQLTDPAGFCRALVTYIYEQQQQQQQQGHEGAGTPSAAVATSEGAAEPQQLQREHLIQALKALRQVLESTPRLLGLLATKPAVDPLLECLRPACTAGLAVPLPASAAAAEGARGTEAVAALAAALPPWVVGGTPPAGTSAAALEIAELALLVLLRLTAHAGCIEALSQDKCVAQAFWLAHRAPNTALLMLALRLLHAMAGTAACAWGAAAHGGTVFLLTLLLPAYTVPEEQRAAFEAACVAAASLLSRLAAHPLHGARVTLLLSKLLPPGLVAAVQDGPGEAAVAALAQTSETPERVWNRGMQRAAAEEAAHLAATARVHQAASGTLEWQPPEGFRLCFQELLGELLVGGVYVRLFLKDPHYPLRNPKAFLEGLLERYVLDVQRATPSAGTLGSPSKPTLLGNPATSTALAATTTAAAKPAAAGADEQQGGSSGGPDLPLLLSAAAVALLQAQPALAEHAVSLGYVEKLLRLLAARVPVLPPGGLTAELLDGAPLLPDEISGSLLRLLHQLSSSIPAAEALARCTPPAVPPLLGAMRWGTGAAVLALETLKRGLAPANRWRDTLVGACLTVGLVPLLLQRLDWRHSAAQPETDGQQEERDASVQRVLWVDVLNLLALEGAHGERVRAALDASDVWAAYRGQRHDLFLPAGGSHISGVAGLLQGPQAARFALPALTAPPPLTTGAAAVVPAAAPAPPSVAVPLVAAAPAAAPVPAVQQPAARQPLPPAPQPAAADVAARPAAAAPALQPPQQVQQQPPGRPQDPLSAASAVLPEPPAPRPVAPPAEAMLPAILPPADPLQAARQSAAGPRQGQQQLPPSAAAPRRAEQQSPPLPQQPRQPAAFSDPLSPGRVGSSASGVTGPLEGGGSSMRQTSGVSAVGAGAKGATSSRSSSDGKDWGPLGPLG